MFKPYMLTYDLNSPGQRYEDFRNVIKMKYQMVGVIIGIPPLYFDLLILHQKLLINLDHISTIVIQYLSLKLLTIKVVG